MEIAAIGFSCVDVYEDIDRQYATGNGIDCIVNLAKKGVKASAITAVGNDEYGITLIKLCESYQIDTSHIQIKNGATSIFRMALKNGTDRVHLENIAGVMEDYAPTKADIEFVKEHKYVHTDMYGKVLHLLPEFRSAGCQIILDFSLNKEFSVVGKVLPNIDYGFFSFEKKDDSVKDFLINAYSYGPKLVTATYGEDGSICYDGSRFYEQGIYKVPVVNTVGAGDSFIAGFTYGLMNHWDIPSCLESGAKTAAEIVQMFNPY